MKKIVFLLCVFKYAYNLTPTTRVEQGELFGKKYTLSNGKVINAFLGIPYAAPPVSDYRFQSPQKLTPWQGVYNASFFRSECLQKNMRDNFKSIKGDEDCLYLNIYTPELPNDDNKPLFNVFVYIHGGAFNYGIGNLLPDRFLEANDIVFVSMNYRLGVFGFLSMNDTEAPGNYGLKDQSAALKWIKKNIHNFGGNSDSITIAGVSAGGVSVDFHMLHSTDEDLFHKALSFSGSALVSWAIRRTIDEKSKLLANDVGCSFNNTIDVVKCLRQKSASELIQAQTKVSATERHPIIFGPVIEVDNSDAFLTNEPITLLKTGKVKDIPWISSMVQNEGLISVARYSKSDKYFQNLDQNWIEEAPLIFDYVHTSPKALHDSFSTSLRQFYFGNRTISRETMKDLVQVFSDRSFFNGIIDSSIQHSVTTKSNIYCLRFNYRGERSWTNLLAMDTNNYGVCHGDDVQYFLKYFPLDNLRTQTDIAISKLLTSMIVNFMETGNPNKVVPQWQPIAKNLDSDINCLNIYSPEDIKMETIPINSPMRKLWNTIIPLK